MIRLGVYRHYSGRTYRVTALAKHSETHEDMVVYEALYENDFSRWYVRPIELFTDEVEYEGKKVPHFEYIGE